MMDSLNQLIESLRSELKEYGEMLALLEEQQTLVLARNSDAVLASAARVDTQSTVLRRMRAQREAAQQALARQVEQPESSGLFVLAQVLPPDYRPLLQALVRENNQLLGRVQQRARQNHILLSRSLDLMQRFIQSLAPAQAPTVYGGNGTVQANASGHVLYEAVG